MNAWVKLCPDEALQARVLGAVAAQKAIETDDVLAAILARLLLWTESAALPPLADTAAAWALYLRAWRPGAYARGTAAERAPLRKK